MKTLQESQVSRMYEGLQEEHDACGIGTIVNIDGHQDYQVLDDALHIVEKLEHRARNADVEVPGAVCRGDINKNFTADSVNHQYSVRWGK